MNWVAASIISTFAFSITALLLKKLTLFEMKSEIINFYFLLTASAVFLLFALFKNDSFKIDAAAWPWFVILAIVAAFANYFSVIALSTAPNPGYVRAIISAQVVIVTLISIFLFKSTLSLQAVIGIIFSLIGVYLLATIKTAV